MGENSKIEWTHHTFNGWRGCRKVSPGCANCYAEAGSHRNPAVLGGWGNDPRVIGSDAYWRQPLLWDRKAEADGVRRRVFALSLGDWLEDRPELVAPRARLLATIGATPHLDWLLLTKRPEGWCDRLHEVVREAHDGGDAIASGWLAGFAPHNVWVGASVEDQATADERIPHLLQVPAAVRFVSAEPLLGPVDLDAMSRAPGAGDDLTEEDYVYGPPLSGLYGIRWVIVGGESGPGARPFDFAWARSIRDRCKSAGVSCFIKQVGARPTGYWLDPDGPGDGICHAPMRKDHWSLRDKKGGNWFEWPEDLRVRQFPEASRCD